MPISSAEREVIFKTPVLSRQMRKYVEAKGKVSIKQMRLDFADVGTNSFYKSVYQMIEAGSVLREGDYLSILAGTKPVVGSLADCAWQAARLLKCFTAAKLALTSGTKLNYATTLCAKWVKAGYLTRLETNGASHVYRLVSTSIMRPVNTRRKKQRSRT